jgi:endogenous inhibitor of DNA gyrase (YacG/DUF329 family)
MRSDPPTVTCPTCATAVVWDSSSRWRPFCSRRCRLIDLGDWLSEEHRIAGDPAGPGEDGIPPPDDDELPPDY